MLDSTAAVLLEEPLSIPKKKENLFENKTNTLKFIKRKNLGKSIQDITEKIKFYFPSAKITITLLGEDMVNGISGDLIFYIDSKFSKEKDNMQLDRLDYWWKHYKIKNHLYFVCIALMPSQYKEV